MHQQKSKKILIYLILLLIIGTFNNKNFNNIDFMKIKKINIVGLDEQNNIELMNKLKLLNINSLFFLNKFQTSEIISSNTLVEKYSVFKKYPATLRVNITKTKFLAQIKKNDKFFLLGSNGKLTQTKKINKDIPFIFGKFKNEYFLELKKAIDETKFNYMDIKNLFFFPSRRWDIETKSGIIIRLPKDNLKNSLSLSLNILKNDKFRMINKIDLRQNYQIIIDG